MQIYQFGTSPHFAIFSVIGWRLNILIMYKEEWIEIEGKNEKELTIDFGKNMRGLSDELINIGNKINELSKTNTIFLRDTFVDELDDVYQFKFVLFPNA